MIRHFLGPASVLKLRLKNLRLRRHFIVAIFAIGMAPFSMQLIASVSSIIFNQGLANYGGDAAIGAFGPYLNDPKYATPGDPSHPVVTDLTPFLRVERNLVCITDIRFNRFHHNCDCSGCETTQIRHKQGAEQLVKRSLDNRNFIN